MGQIVDRAGVVLLIAVWCMVFLYGCAFLQRGYTSFQACRDDPECVAEMTATASAIDVVGKQFGVSDTVVGGIGMLISLVAGAFFGRKMKRGY